MIKFEDFVEIHKIYEGVADAYLQKKHHFSPEFSDFEDDYKKLRSKEDNTDEIEDVKMNIENSNDEFKSNLINKFTFVVMKRLVIKNLRPKKINVYLKNEEENGYKKNEMRSTLSIIMNNKDIIIGTYAGENVAITINDEIVYDVDRKEFNDNKFIDKLSEEYVKYLKNKGYNIKYGQN